MFKLHFLTFVKLFKARFSLNICSDLVSIYLNLMAAQEGFFQNIFFHVPQKNSYRFGMAWWWAWTRV